jgi:hypothetical protein
MIIKAHGIEIKVGAKEDDGTAFYNHITIFQIEE